MPIDLRSEPLLDPFVEIPKRLPPRPGGKKVHRSTIVRWMVRGVRGNRLEWIRFGQRRLTTEAAIERFVTALSGRSDERARPSARQTAAEAELDRILG